MSAKRKRTSADLVGGSSVHQNAPANQNQEDAIVESRVSVQWKVEIPESWQYGSDANAYTSNYAAVQLPSTVIPFTKTGDWSVHIASKTLQSSAPGGTGIISVMQPLYVAFRIANSPMNDQNSITRIVPKLQSSDALGTSILVPFTNNNFLTETIVQPSCNMHGNPKVDFTVRDTNFSEFVQSGIKVARGIPVEMFYTPGVYRYYTTDSDGAAVGGPSTAGGGPTYRNFSSTVLEYTMYFTPLTANNRQSMDQ